MTKILAFNITHDSSVAYLEHGVLKFFCKEERLTRTKRDSHPFKSLDLFRSLGYEPDHILFMTPSNIEPDIFHTYKSYLSKFFKAKIENFSFLNHHEAHAIMAFCNSRFDESLIFVIDRNGSIFFNNGNPVARESESIYIGSKKKNILDPIYKNFWLENNESLKTSTEQHIKNYYSPLCDVYARSQYGIVTAYEAATTLIGQNPLENGKTMGLSSYCEAQNYENLFYKGFVDSKFFMKDLSTIDPKYANLGICFFEEHENITWEVDETNFQYYAEKAKQVQLNTQEAVCNLIKTYVDKTNIKKVCIVGGYGLNVVANSVYIKNFPNVEFYFEPCADDTGISLGGTLLKHLELTNSIPDGLDNNFYHYFNDKEQLSYNGKKSDVNEICDLLINQKSVAIFEGAPEAGPRALGHRSILFDPRNKQAKNIVNQIKNREWYRPFAGIILKEKFDEYFETMGLSESKFMTINFDAMYRTKNLVPGIIHVDNSCRVQTVSEGFLYEILSLFYKKTGCPMLLNTSFNLAGEALVQTKKDAVNTYNKSTLDALFFVDSMEILKKL